MLKKLLFLLSAAVLGVLIAMFLENGVLKDKNLFQRDNITASAATYQEVVVVVEEPEVVEIEEDLGNKGLLMFRGNKERNFYGTGPIPMNPEVAWRYPDKPMCRYSTSLGNTNHWCGSGWTGQPVVW